MTSFVGEIRMFGGTFAPAGWMMCDGQLLPIAENETLFNLIGTTYGGDGQSTFALPDLRGRIPMHAGNSNPLAMSTGSESVTLTTSQIPFHSHTALAGAGVGHLSEPGSAVPAAHRDFAVFDASTNTPMAASLASSGGNQPHDNMPPYLCVTFIISLFGIFPTQN